MQRQLVWLLTITAGFEGIRAGAGTFRALLDLPARSILGPVAFAELSRATDLSPAGVAFYSLYGVGGLIVTAGTLFIAFRAKSPMRIIVETAVSAISSLAILLLTIQAAPLMWAIGSSANDPMTLAELIEPFVFWTNLRIGLADLSFAAILLALGSSAAAAKPH